MNNIEIIESKDCTLIKPMIEEVQNLHAEYLPAIYKPFDEQAIQEALTKILSDNNCRVLIALMEGKPIAYVLVMIKDIPESAFYYAYRILHIDQLCVLKTHQQTGVGSLLMNKVEELARHISITRIELEHLHFNTAAAGFFRRKAFVPYREKLCKQL